MSRDSESPPVLTKQKLQDALAEWDRWSSLIAGPDLAFDVVLERRKQALDGIIAAAREVLRTDEPGVRIETDAEIAAGLTMANPAYPSPPKDGPAPDMRRYEPPAPRAEQWSPDEIARMRMEQAINMCQGCFRPVSACVCSSVNRTSAHE